MKRTACVTCWALIKVPDDYTDLVHKGVCSEACASKEHDFIARTSDYSYFEYMQATHNINQREKEKNVPRNPRYTPPKAS